MRFKILLACLFLSFCAKAQLEINVMPESSLAGNAEKKSGWTEVAQGNTKGQSFSIKRAGSLEGVVLQVGSVSAAQDLKLKLFATEGGFPVGEALYADAGTLPSGLKEGDSLQIKFAAGVDLSAGDYALVLESDTSNLRFRLSRSHESSSGRLIRNNKSTRGRWSIGNGKESCLAYTLLGEGMPASNASAVPAEPAGPVELIRDVSRNVKPLCDSLPKKPNIVVCMVDDLGWNQISVKQSTMGTCQSEFKTPNIEKLASRGLSFTHAYTQPNCAPTRAAMLSGQYPARVHNGVYVVGNLNRFGGRGISKKDARFTGPEQSENVAAEAITVAEALRHNGYATAHIGKYHVGGHGGDETLPENVGFDINIGGCSQGNQPVCFASKGASDTIWRFKGLGRGDFDRFAQPYTAEYLKKYGFPESLAGTPKHVTDAVGDAMEETVRKLSATEKPFYLQLHTYAIHSPVKARPDLQDAADGSKLAGFVAGVDLVIGRLLKAIDDPDGDGNTGDSLAKNTLILFTSDNGGTHGDNLPLRGHKGMFTEGGVRVPLIAYWPGVIPPDSVTDHMVHSVDYYPTCLELAGRGWIPPESEHPLDGESFADVLRKPDIERDRGPVFYLFPGYMDERAQPCAVVLDEQGGKRYKLLYFYEADAWELYNLTDDIGETKNLIKEKPELASTLSKKINAWLTQEHSTWKPKYPIEKSSGQPAGPPPVL